MKLIDKSDVVARNLTNVRCEEIRNKIKEYEKGLVERCNDKR